MHHFIRTLSIRNKLIASITLASMMTLALETSAIVFWDSKNLEDAYVENAYAITSALSNNFIKILLLDDFEIASDTVSTLRSFNTVIRVFFYNNDGTPIFQYHQDNKITPPPDISNLRAFSQNHDAVLILQPLYYDNELYGKVYIEINKDFIIHWQTTQRNRLIAFIIIISIFAFIFAISVEPLITRPIIKLAKAMQKVESDHDFSQQVYTEEKREIGQLYNGFNTMLASVNKYSKNLQDHKYAIDQAAIVSITDVKGNIIYVNDHFINTSQYSKEELMGQNHRIIKSNEHDAQLYKDMWKTIANGNVWSGEVCNQAKDHSLYWVQATIVPFLNEKAKPIQYMGIRYLITDKKDVEQKLADINILQEQIIEKRTQELEASNEHLLESEKMASLGGLVAGIAHEINTPIGIGVTAASHLSAEIDELQKAFLAGTLSKDNFNEFVGEAKEAGDLIQNNLRRAAKIIRSFKEVAVDQTSEEKRIFNLNEYLHEILINLNPKLKQTKHNIQIICPEDLNLYSLPGAYSQIVTNLIMNSLIHAYAANEWGEIKINITQQQDEFTINYSDDGCGMSKADKNKIFEPFFTTKRGQGGSGLGMHIVFNLVTQSLNGKIKCYSTLSKGTRFEILLPLTTEIEE